jgi:hypothetical protein
MLSGQSLIVTPSVVEGSVKIDFSIRFAHSSRNDYLYRLPILTIITNSYIIELKGKLYESRQLQR